MYEISSKDDKKGKHMKYYLGLDNGGTTTKASVYNETGNELATVSVDTSVQTLKPGYTERDMEEMWEANCSVIRETLQKAGISGKQVACVAVCGHGKGLYLWGKNNRPVRNGILSTDNRAFQYPLQWAEDGTEQEVSAHTCQHILSSQPVALLAWFKNHEPEVLESTKWIFTCKDYVRFRLTGEAYAERTDYSGCNFLNLYTGEYDLAVLKSLGLEECKDMLPPLKNSTDICGRITGDVAEKTGLAEGIPVAGGAFDIDACALAVGITDESHLCMIAGTWSINEYIRRTPVTDGSVMMNSIFCIPGYYLVEECSPTSAGNNAWFAKQLMPELLNECKTKGENIYEVMNRWVAEISEEEFCPIYLPFLMASNVHPSAMAGFVGMSSFHTRKHLVRSIYEGIAFSHRYHMEKLLNTRKEMPQAIRLAGGAARSPIWTQMFADVMKLPIESVNVTETGTFGCAILGAVAIGDYPDVTAAWEKMGQTALTVYPNERATAIYDEKYELYCRTIESLDGLWDDLQGYRERHS